jgi:hypothetical protein
VLATGSLFLRQDECLAVPPALVLHDLAGEVAVDDE